MLLQSLSYRSLTILLPQCNKEFELAYYSHLKLLVWVS